MNPTTHIDPKLVKTLREKTNAGMMDCKNALEEAKGNLEEAERILRKKLNLAASRKSDRVAKEGTIASYIHLGGKVGVLLEVNCETDFVAKNENFRDFVKDITLHIAAANPLYVSRDEVPESVLKVEREIAADQVKGKPAAVAEKIIQGKVDKYYASACLLDQPFIKDQNVTVGELLRMKIGEIGENMIIRRFVRYAVGEV